MKLLKEKKEHPPLALAPQEISANCLWVTFHNFFCTYCYGLNCVPCADPVQMLEPQPTSTPTVYIWR